MLRFLFCPALPARAAMPMAVMVVMALPVLRAAAAPPASPSPSTAATANPAGLRAATEAAWLRSAAGRSEAERRAEIDARRASAGSWMADAPSLALSERSDRLNTGQGFREWEAEVALPLHWPAARRANRHAADADASAFHTAEASRRLEVAGEVREALWQARLSLADREAARGRVQESAAFADDVARRVRAGDLARIDLNAALGLQQQALAGLAEADGDVLRAQRAWRTLTGFDALPADDEVEPGGIPEPDAHAALLSRRRAVEAARAKLGQASASAWGSPELTLGVTRERDVIGAATVQTARVGIRIPFPLSSQSQPRQYGARAEIAQAEAELALAQERLRAEADTARAELAQARRIEQLTAERARLADDSHALIDKAFRLGQADLPTRLRAESERFDARLAARRAGLETGRALSRLQQTYGVMP